MLLKRIVGINTSHYIIIHLFIHHLFVLECCSPTIKTRKKRKQIFIESDSDSEPEILEQKSKRACVFSEGNNEEDMSFLPSSFTEEETASFEETPLSPSCDVRVVSFLETGTMKDLISVPGLSQAKVEKILSLKPFIDENDIVSFSH